MMWSIVILLTGVAIHYAYDKLWRDRLTEPFDGTPLSVNYNSSKWGSFRSGSYFGLKRMSPVSPVIGFLWFRNEIEGNSVAIRHWCSQFDRLTKYGWVKHDFDSFGVQDIKDDYIQMTTSFLVDDQTDSWSARIRVDVDDSKTKSDVVSVIFYVATQNPEDDIRIHNGKFKYPADNDFVVDGTSPDENHPEYRVSISTHVGTSDDIIEKRYLSAKSLPPLVLLKETILQNLGLIRIRDEPKIPYLIVLDQKSESPETRPNVIAHQIIFRSGISVDINYSGKNSKSNVNHDNYENLLKESIESFEHLFESIFHLKSKGFNESQVAFGQSALSNMIGSIGYFSGYSRVQSSKIPEPVNYGPLELLTGVPSRSFFPRGFLWDEGFHHLLISQFKPQLTTQIVKSWLNLMNAEGWIPREVILGQEAEARVPQEFVVQRNTNANPPSLFLTIESLMKRNLLLKEDLTEMYPRLKAWFNWFNTTQSGSKYTTYRWMGRKDIRTELNPKTLTSGLDDYPRASSPTDDEMHVDLRCWMALSSRIMAKISGQINHDDEQIFKETADRLNDNQLLEDIHWSPDHHMFCDRGLHSKNVRLVKDLDPEKPKTRKELTPASYGCVPEYGYVSLFPLMLEILEPSNPILGRTLSDLSNPKLLWTPYGLRSLSKNSPYYLKYNTEHDPPYWRGYIWINMNFLVLRSLYNYSNRDGPYQKAAGSLYSKLREALISNMFREYERSGYIWENYDDLDGKGKGSHPFTGWSGLILLIMSEKY